MGNAESNPVRNMDKRTARREYNEDFSSAIKNYRSKVADDPGVRAETGREEAGGGAGGGGRVRVCVRKRPIFKAELKDHEFDVLTCIGKHKLIVHDARMHMDMKKMYLHHSEFTFDHAFSESAANRDVYDGAASALVHAAVGGGFATCLMYGQTGSGSKLRFVYFFVCTSLVFKLCYIHIS
jgi:kinesin family protein 2/24